MNTLARIGAIMVVGLAAGCGESIEEAHQRGYYEGFDDGRDQGVEDGKSEALECVRNEGGGAEDAADSCE